MKCVPDGSTVPSGPGASVALSTRSIPKWRSVAPSCALPAASASAVAASGESSPGATPCSGWSIAISTRPAEAMASASVSAWERLPVMPCWKIVTGQPPSGATPPLGEAAFGTVRTTGTVTVVVSTGTKSVGSTGEPAALFQVLLIAATWLAGSSADAAIR